MRKVPSLLFVGVILVLCSMIVLVAGSDGSLKKSSTESYKSVSTELLKEYVSDANDFEGLEIGDKKVFFKQRKIGDVTVELDFQIYQFDKDTNKLLRKEVHERDIGDVPRVKVSKKKAEKVVEGNVLFSELYLISPESYVFPIEPLPTNPVWAVRSEVNGRQKVTIIDAVTNEFLGYGVPPPSNAFSLSGVIDSPCNRSWDEWVNNSYWWMGEMGYNSIKTIWPGRSEIQSQIQSTETAVFYEVAHGGSDNFIGGCSADTYEWTYATDVHDWMLGYEKMPFTFLSSCDSMCETGPGTFSHEFRKGSYEDTVTIGYCGMSEEQCSLCFQLSVIWQDRLFMYLDRGYTVSYAWEKAMNVAPPCVGCARIEDDENLRLVPLLTREPDSDGDGVPDSTDNCIDIGNSNQLDFDNDNYGDVCDNCVFVDNPTQLNSDNDNYGAACDCDDSNVFVYPGAQEYCDGVDSDCDLILDGSEGLPAINCGSGNCVGLMQCTDLGYVGNCSSQGNQCAELLCENSSTTCATYSNSYFYCDSQGVCDPSYLTETCEDNVQYDDGSTICDSNLIYGCQPDEITLGADLFSQTATTYCGSSGLCNGFVDYGGWNLYVDCKINQLCSASIFECVDQPCEPADIDNDGNVDVGDLAILSVNWDCSVGVDCTDDRADITFDGVVDVGDLAVLSANWDCSVGGAGTGLDFNEAYSVVMDAQPIWTKEECINQAKKDFEKVKAECNVLERWRDRFFCRYEARDDRKSAIKECKIYD